MHTVYFLVGHEPQSIIVATGDSWREIAEEEWPNHDITYLGVGPV